MKKLFIAFAGIIMMLTATSCGNDEPKDVVWIMNTQLINHITDGNSGDFVSASLGGIYIEFNTTKMTANIAYEVKVGSDQEVFNLTNVPMVIDYDHNGYVIRSNSSVNSLNHTMSGLSIFIDMNLNKETLGHWANATIDGKYELNGLVPIIAFNGVNSTINLPDGSNLTDKNGSFTFEMIDFDSDNRSANLKIMGVRPVDVLNRGLTYERLKLEVTAQGLHITSDKKLLPFGETQYQLNEIDVDIDIFSHTMSSTIDIENVAKLTSQASL